MERSALGVMVVELVALALALFDALTVAVLLIGLVADPVTVATRVMADALVLVARVGIVHVTVVVPVQVHPVPLAETKVVPAGRGSETETEVAATVALLLVTVKV